jgi:hypothetical protein
MEYVGIDLHKKESQICLLTETGEVIERRIRTESQRFAEVLGGRPRARILVEASTESEWVARCLEALGHEVVVAHPNFAPMYATRTGRSRPRPRLFRYRGGVRGRGVLEPGATPPGQKATASASGLTGSGNQRLAPGAGSR